MLSLGFWLSSHSVFRGGFGKTQYCAATTITLLPEFSQRDLLKPHDGDEHSPMMCIIKCKPFTLRIHSPSGLLCHSSVACALATQSSFCSLTSLLQGCASWIQSHDWLLLTAEVAVEMSSPPTDLTFLFGVVSQPFCTTLFYFLFTAALIITWHSFFVHWMSPMATTVMYESLSY